MTEGADSIAFDVPQTQTARKGVDDPTTQGDENEIVANSYKLATANAVYEYVTDYVGDTYQPKANSSNPQVGIRTGDGTNTPYNSTWYTMMEGQQNGVNTVPFVRINSDAANSEVHVDLYHGRIIGSDNLNQGTGYYTSGIDGTNAGNRLATGIAVYNYAVPMNWQERAPSGYANKKLVTDNSGNVILAEDTGSVIPPESEMPQVCAEGTAVCALVAYYDADTGNNGANAGIKYEWTVMAGTGA